MVLLQLVLENQGPGRINWDENMVAAWKHLSRVLAAQRENKTVLDIGSSFVTHLSPTSHSEADLASDLLHGIPKRALNIIKGGNFGGADLVKLESEISRPSFRDRLGLDCVVLVLMSVFVGKDKSCLKPI